MADETIKSFLVGLDFKVDRNQEKRFKDSIVGSSKTVEGLSKSGLGVARTFGAVAGAITAAATVIYNQLDKASRPYEQLFYSAARSGASVKGIQRFGFAVSQLGGTVEGARSSLEGFGAFMRSSPGAETFVQRLGVHTRDVHGHLRDTSNILTDVGDDLRAMPIYRAQQYASVMGIDVPTLFALRSGVRGFEKDLDHYYKLVGFNADKAGQMSVRFEQQRRSMDAFFQATKDALTFDVEGAFFRVEDFVSKWWPTVQRDLDPMTKYLSGEFSQAWAEMSKGVQGDITAIMTMIRTTDWKGGLASWVKDLGNITKALNDAAAGHYAAAAKDIGAVVSNDTKQKPQLTPDWHDTQKAIDQKTNGWFSRTMHRIEYSITGRPTPEMDDRADTVVGLLEAAGYTPAAAVGILGNVARESTIGAVLKGGDGKHFGLAQWDRNRSAAILKATGIDVRTDHNIGDQTKALIWELQGPESATRRALAGATDYKDASRIFNHGYERSATIADGYNFEDRARESLARDWAGRYGLNAAPPAPGKTAPVLNQSTTIHVAGSSDPHTTAHAVAKAQTRVNTDLVRNTVAAAW